MDLLTKRAQAAASSRDCWHMLYMGLIREFEKLTPEEKGTHAISGKYFYLVGYTFGRFKVQEDKVREAMLDG